MDAPEFNCFDLGFPSVMDYMEKIGLVVQSENWAWVAVVLDQDFDFFRQFFLLAVSVDSIGKELNALIRRDFLRYISNVDGEMSRSVRRQLAMRAMYDDGYRVVVDTAIGFTTPDLRYIAVVRFRQVHL